MFLIHLKLTAHISSSQIKFMPPNPEADMQFPAQGYLSRPDWKQAVQIPFAQIPSGSGNALAANCGLWSPVTAAHAICKGRQSPVDIASIAQPGRARTYSFLSVTFGMISNLDVGTDHLRCARPQLSPNRKLGTCGWQLLCHPPVAARAHWRAELMALSIDRPSCIMACTARVKLVLQPWWHGAGRWMGALRFHYGGLLEIAKGNAFLCKLALLPADAAEAQLTGVTKRYHVII